MENENQSQYLIRLIIISILSVSFLYVWNTFISPPATYYQSHPAKTNNAFEVSSSLIDEDKIEQQGLLVAERQKRNFTEEFYTLSNDKVKLVFSTKNAIVAESYIYFNDGLVSANLETANHRGSETGNLIFSDLSISAINQQSFYNVLEETTDKIVFHYTDNKQDMTVYKTYTLTGYQLDLKIDIKKKDDYPLTFSLLNGSYLGETNFADNEDSVFNRVQVGYNKGMKYKKVFGFDLFGFLKSEQEKNVFDNQNSCDWIAIDDRFFGRILKTYDQNASSTFLKIKNADGLDQYLHGYRFTAKNDFQTKYSFYFLPKNRDLFSTYYTQEGEHFFNLFHQMKINRVLSNVMYKILQLIFQFLQDYGWSVIVMTIFIKLLVFPLTQKSMKSMQKMADLAPQLENLRKTHKKNPKQLNVESMALYRKHNVNPIMGCFPILLTIPVFIALYSLFQSMIELKGVSFYWIDDLALPDVIATLGFHIPLMGNQVRLLPILMVLTSFLQSLYTPMPTAKAIAGGTENEDSKKKQQRQMAMMMKYYMPIMLFFISWNMPSALVLYWTCQNIFSLFQTFLLKISKNKDKLKG